MNVFQARWIAAGRVAPDPDWGMKAHFHAFHELIVVIRGKMRVRMAGETAAVSAGDVLLYPALVPHEEEADRDDPVETVFIAFMLEDLRARTLMRRHDANVRMRQLVRWIYDDRDANNPLARTGLRALTHALLAEFFRTETRPAGHEMADRIRRYVREHARDRLTLDVLAREAGLSKYYFLRVYRKLTGRTPMADARAIRADMARDLLLTTSLPIKAVAPQAGLGDEYSMSRVFKQLFGMPPGEFRRHPGR